MNGSKLYIEFSKGIIVACEELVTVVSIYFGKIDHR